MPKTRQRRISLFEFGENINTQECIDFITRHLPLLKHYTLGFREHIDEELQNFLQSHHLSFAILSGEIPERSNSHIKIESDSINMSNAEKGAIDKSIEKKGAFERTLWIHRIVRSGEDIYHNGDIVIESRVNSGAHIVAEGNLFLFGKCQGSIEVQGEFILCHKILTSTILFQDIIIGQEILHKINQSSALFKMIFKNGDNIAIKDLV